MAASSQQKIVFIASRPLSEPVLYNRIIPFAELLLSYGYEVCLVCPQYSENEALRPSTVQLHEVPVPDSRHLGFIKRAICEIRDAYFLLKQAKSIQADAWLITIPSMFLAFVAPFVLWRRKVVLDVRDLSWEYLSEKSVSQRLGKRVFRTAFRCSLSFFRAVAVTNPAELEYVTRFWKGKRLPMLVSNGVARDRFNSLADLGSPDKGLSVTYIGNIGLAQQLDTLVDAAKHLPEVRFTIIGTGVEFGRISRLVAESRLANVHLTGLISWESVREFYSKSDILYAQLAHDFSGAVPSKLYEYLATGKYILYAGQGEAVTLLSSFEHNQVIPPCDVAALVSAIKAYDKGQSKQEISLANREKIRVRHIREDAAEQLIQCIIRVSLEVDEGPSPD